jgi:hypothetical protein
LCEISKAPEAPSFPPSLSALTVVSRCGPQRTDTRPSRCSQTVTLQPVSANGDSSGIVWTIDIRNWQIIPEKLAVVHAYDALDVSHELYNSEQESDRDRAGISVRFTIPTVSNGRVYVGTRGEVDIYGLLAEKGGL